MAHATDSTKESIADNFNVVATYIQQLNLFISAIDEVEISTCLTHFYAQANIAAVEKSQCVK